MSPNVTEPGPLSLLQVVVTVLPTGKPSSVTVVQRTAPSGSVIVCPGPATTSGAWFVGVTTLKRIPFDSKEPTCTYTFPLAASVGTLTVKVVEVAVRT